MSAATAGAAVETPRAAGAGVREGRGVERRFRVSPTNNGLVFAALGAVILFAAFNSGTNLVYLVTSLLGGFYFTSFLYAAGSLRGLSLSCHLDRETAEGEEFAWEVEVRNDGLIGGDFIEVRPRFLASRSRDGEVGWLDEQLWKGGDRRIVRAIRQWRREGRPGESHRLLRVLRELSTVPQKEGEPGRVLRVKPGSGVRVPLRTRLPMRGDYRLDRLEIYTTFPLNLMRVCWSYRPGGRVVVLPRTLRPFYAAATRSELEVELESLVDSHRGEGLDYHGLREYVPGDPPRRIHWKVSARADKLFVREHQQNRSARYYLFLDLGRHHLDGDGPGSNLEQCVRLAATVCRELVTANCHSQIILLADEMAPSPAIYTASELGVMLRYLGAAPYTERSSVAGMLSKAAPQLAPDAYVVFILPRLDGEECDAMAGLAAKGHRVAALVHARDLPAARELRSGALLRRLAMSRVQGLIHCQSTDSVL